MRMLKLVDKQMLLVGCFSFVCAQSGIEFKLQSVSQSYSHAHNQETVCVCVFFFFFCRVLLLLFLETGPISRSGQLNPTHSLCQNSYF